MRRRTIKQRHDGERGFALLLVFLMASAVALLLYMQVPREAFESERDKEQMLIDRGEQYKRAISMYYVTNNHQWPARMEDLENTNNKRFLRHRYVDPYTGKDEWRLVHTNGAFLTDSLVTPPPAQANPVSGGALAGTGPPTGPGSGTGSTSLTASTTADPNAPPAVNAQVLRRPSDQALVQNSNFQNLGGGANPGTDPAYQPFNPNAPISMFPNGYNAPTQPGQPGVNQPGVNQPGVNQPGQNQPGFNQPGFNPPGVNQPGGVNVPPGVPGFTAPGVSVPGAPGVTNTPGNFNQPGFNQPVVNQPVGNQPVGFLNQPGQNQPGGQNPQFPQQFPDPSQTANNPGVPGAPAGPPNQAINLINQLLTTPRQPPPGIGPGSQPQQAGGGIAGVASTFKGPSIKTYADRSKYQEWEFVFQLQQATLQAPAAALGPAGGPSGPNATNSPNAAGGSSFFSNTPGTSGTPGSSTTSGSTTGGTSGFTSPFSTPTH